MLKQLLNNQPNQVLNFKNNLFYLNFETWNLTPVFVFPVLKSTEKLTVRSTCTDSLQFV